MKSEFSHILAENIVTGENDSYYGSSSARETYSKIVQLYKEKGVSEKEIAKLVVLDIKDGLHGILTRIRKNTGRGIQHRSDKKFV